MALIGDGKELAIIDAPKRLLVRTLRFKEEIDFVTGKTRFVVYERDSGRVARWRLEPLEQEGERKVGPLAGMVMGANSEGPLFVQPGLRSDEETDRPFELWGS